MSPRHGNAAVTAADLREYRPAVTAERGGNALTSTVTAAAVTLAGGVPATPWPPGPAGGHGVQAKHGLWPEDVARMREAQQDKCYLCEGPLPIDGYFLAIDHDHRCCPAKRSCAYCRRGLACHSCNVLIGHALGDVLNVFEDAKGLHWQVIADRLAAQFPDRWADASKNAVSAQIRALDVPGVNIRCPASQGGKVLWGCRRTDVEAAVANRQFWLRCEQ